MTFAKSFSCAAALAVVLAACAPAPRSAAPPPAPPAGEAAQGHGIFLKSAQSGEWAKAGVTDARYQADLEDCHRYAEAQVAHDMRMESDSQAAFESFPTGLGWTELRGRQSDFEQGKRRGILFSDCMEAKGYDRR